MGFYINESLNMVHVTYMLYVIYIIASRNTVGLFLFVCLFF